VNSANATLIGDSITGSLTNQLSGFGSSVTTTFDSSAVVGAGAEFNGVWNFYNGYQNWDIAVDVAATSVTVTAQIANNPDGNLYAYSNPLFRIDLGDLDIGGSITGISLTSGIGQFPTYFGSNTTYDVVTSAFTADSLSLTWFNLPSATTSGPYGAKGVWTFEILHDGSTGSTDVPEPATLALVGLGLFGLGMSRSKQKKAALSA